VEFSMDNSSSSSLPENLTLLPLPPTKTALPPTETVPMDDAILLQLSVPSLPLWIASESQSLLSSLSSDDDSLSLGPKIGLA
jgi:hypothetical protein